MKLFILIATLAVSSFAGASLPNDFSATGSQSRRDGIMVTFAPAYPYAGEIFYTMAKSQCYPVGTPTPFADSSGVVSVMKVNHDGGGFPQQTPAIFDSLAPEGVQLCYMLVGRGQVEAVAWGLRMPSGSSDVPDKIGFFATRDRMDGIRLTKNPPLTDFSEIYATPDADTCPRVDDRFSMTGRFEKVGVNFFNGSYYLDTKAAIAIDLCYFLISKRTGLVTDVAWGYRQP